jgi:hypothetical protein
VTRSKGAKAREKQHSNSNLQLDEVQLVRYANRVSRAAPPIASCGRCIDEQKVEGRTGYSRRKLGSFVPRATEPKLRSASGTVRSDGVSKPMGQTGGVISVPGHRRTKGTHVHIPEQIDFEQDHSSNLYVLRERGSPPIFKRYNFLPLIRKRENTGVSSPYDLWIRGILYDRQHHDWESSSSCLIQRRDGPHRL